jgi:hypothetical protein
LKAKVNLGGVPVDAAIVPLGLKQMNFTAGSYAATGV